MQVETCVEPDGRNGQTPIDELIPNQRQHQVNLQSVLNKELAYYRANFREAFQKDGVISLECGAIFKYLPGHLCKHNLTSEEYRAKWGYNRTIPLGRLSTRRKKRLNALEMNFGAMTPTQCTSESDQNRS